MSGSVLVSCATCGMDYELSHDCILRGQWKKCPACSDQLPQTVTNTCEGCGRELRNTSRRLCLSCLLGRSIV